MGEGFILTLVTRLARIGILILLLVVACGDDDAVTTTTTGITSTVPATTTSSTASGTTSTTVDDDTVVIVIDGTYGTAPQVLVNGEPRQLGDRIQVDLNDTVRLVVTLAETDEVHVHTYDRILAAPEGEEVELEFVADIPGIFEVELEEAHTLLFELEVA